MINSGTAAVSRWILTAALSALYCALSVNGAYAETVFIEAETESAGGHAPITFGDLSIIPENALITSARLHVPGQQADTAAAELSDRAIRELQTWTDAGIAGPGWTLDPATATQAAGNTDSNKATRPVLEIEYSQTGTASDFSGPWFDPETDGEGYLIYQTPMGWLVYFFGYSSNQEFMWLVSELVKLDELAWGVPFELAMMIGEPGTFQVPTPSSELKPYGTLEMTFDSCSGGEFVLDGLDGLKISNVIKIIGVDGTDCNDGGATGGGEPQKPQADAGSNLVADAGSTVVVEGGGSDPDGEIVSYAWSQVSGLSVSLQNANNRIVQFTAPATSGVVRLKLTVTDNDGLSGSDEVLIEIQEPAAPPNEGPQADAGPDITVQVGQVVEITGQGTDADGQISQWRWSQMSGPAVTLQNAESQTVRFTAPGEAGQVRLRLRVFDNDGAWDTDDVIIYFEDPQPSNQSPTANAGSNRTVETNESVTINGSGSDPDGQITSWAWTQVSGPGVALSGADTQQVQFTAPASASQIRLRLTVTDDDGATDSDDVVITVEATPAPDSVTGYTLESMLPVINAARGVARTCGDDDYPARPPFQWGDNLAEIAMLHSMDMAREGYFSHTSQDGTSMGDRVFPYWRRDNPSGRTVGENIATSTNDRTLQQVVDMWLDSPGHCRLIMSPDYTHIGVGSGHNPDGGWVNNGYTFRYFWTLNFGG